MTLKVKYLLRDLDVSHCFTFYEKASVGNIQIFFKKFWHPKKDMKTEKCSLGFNITAI